jgi:hypothetical protein
MSIAVPTHENSIDLEFSVEKCNFNIYEINSTLNDICGILRVIAVPYRIVKLKKDINNKPGFIMQSYNVLNFINKGKYGKPDNNFIDANNINENEKIELNQDEDYTILSEPMNIYFIIDSDKHYKIRTKSTLTKVEMISNKFDYYGNPIFMATVNTGISYSYAAPKT